MVLDHYTVLHFGICFIACISGCTRVWWQAFKQAELSDVAAHAIPRKLYAIDMTQ
jgi:hypothetical protein